MRRYVLKAIGLCVYSIGTKHVDFVKDLPRYGLSDNLNFTKKQRDHVKQLIGVGGEIFVMEEFSEKKEIPLSKIKDIKDNENKCYVFENAKKQVVKGIKNTGDIKLSFQEPYKMKRVYEVERVLSMLDEYGLKEFLLKEIAVTTKLTKLEE